MKLLKQILDNQQEVKYLTFFVKQDEKTQKIQIELGYPGGTKKYKFQDENACLNRIVDILLDIRRLETWFLNKKDKKK